MGLAPSTGEADKVVEAETEAALETVGEVEAVDGAPAAVVAGDGSFGDLSLIHI